MGISVLFLDLNCDTVIYGYEKRLSEYFIKCSPNEFDYESPIALLMAIIHDK